MSEKLVAVLAYNHLQFNEYVGNEKDDERFVYIDRPEKLWGREFLRVDIIGNFWDRNDAGKLHEEVERRMPHLID